MNLAAQRFVQSLNRHLVWVVVLKVLVLTALWWAVVRDQRVSVDADAAARLLGVAQAASEAPLQASAPTPDVRDTRTRSHDQ